MQTEHNFYRHELSDDVARKAREGIVEHESAIYGLQMQIVELIREIRLIEEEKRKHLAAINNAPERKAEHRTRGDNAGPFIALGTGAQVSASPDVAVLHLHNRMFAGPLGADAFPGSELWAYITLSPSLLLAL